MHKKCVLQKTVIPDTHYIDACIAKIRIWDYVLSNFTVKQLYNEFLMQNPNQTFGKCLILFYFVDLLCVCDRFFWVKKKVVCASHDIVMCFWICFFKYEI